MLQKIKESIKKIFDEKILNYLKNIIDFIKKYYLVIFAIFIFFFGCEKGKDIKEKQILKNNNNLKIKYDNKSIKDTQGLSKKLHNGKY